jgi:2-methylisocitrate lyase-like PEP mutase family enzyme
MLSRNKIMPGNVVPTVSAAEKLRQLLARQEILVLPGCYDALSAKLVERAGFSATFMSGFAVSATRLGMPDTGLISYSEMVDQGRNICSAVSIPVVGDGDTGFGNALNVARTVHGYYQAGFACVMIEDQVMPKRCGHTAGKEVVDWQEALTRIKAAVDVRQGGADILIMARTDARATHGLEEAVSRCRAFVELGADITFLEAPQSEAEMRTYCREVPGPKMVNLVEDGKTPILSRSHLHAMGFKIAVYPLTLLNTAMSAAEQALICLQREQPVPGLMDFKRLRQIVGFDEYDARMAVYRPQENNKSS